MDARLKQYLEGAKCLDLETTRKLQLMIDLLQATTLDEVQRRVQAEALPYLKAAPGAGGQVAPAFVKQVPAKEAKEQPVVQDPAMFEELRKLRQSIALSHNKPAYGIFTNATLAEIVNRKPRTLAELKAIKGVGELKMALYGAQVLKRIAEVLQSRVGSDGEEPTELPEDLFDLVEG